MPSLTLRDDLLGVIRGQLRDRRADDRSLRPRVEETDAVGPRLRAHVVDAAQIVVRMVVHAVPGTGRVDVGPAARDLETLMADLEVGEHGFGGIVDAVHDLAEVVEFVHAVVRLPALPGLEIGERRADLRQRPHDRVVERLVGRRRKLRLPYECRKHSHDIGRLESLRRLRRHGRCANHWPREPVGEGTRLASNRQLSRSRRRKLWKPLRPGSAPSRVG